MCSASLVLVPCEPWSVVGSRGDEAMIYAILRDFRSRHPDGRITIVTGRESAANTEDARRVADDFDVVFNHAWRPRFFLSNIVRAIEDAAATEVYVLGADCMDGHYSVYTSLILLAVADLASRMGIKTSLTGFSWNDAPHPMVVRAFRRVSNALSIVIRDPDSFVRFTSCVRLPDQISPLQAADVAFCLEPKSTDVVRGELDVLNEERLRGNVVMGFNIHSLLVGPDDQIPFCGMVADAIADFMVRRRKVFLAFIPHDYRDGGDLSVLNAVYQRLPEALKHRIHIVSSVMSAEELKALAGGLDVLFTARMHLGIAALGMGKPIAAFAYQGKFTGLFKLFHLDEKLILNPAEGGRLADVLCSLVDGQGLFSKVVLERLLLVNEMSRVNLIG